MTEKKLTLRIRATRIMAPVVAQVVAMDRYGGALGPDALRARRGQSMATANIPEARRLDERVYPWLSEPKPPIVVGALLSPLIPKATRRGRPWKNFPGPTPGLTETRTRQFFLS